MQRLIPSVAMQLGASRRARVALPALPAGYTWLVDGTAVGTVDGDGNTPVDTLVDLAGGGPSLTSSGLLATQKMKSIPADYVVGGRKSLLLANSITNGRRQYLYDPVTDNAFWYPLFRYELASEDATLVIVFCPRNQENGTIFGNFMGSTSGGPGLWLEWESANRRVTCATFKQNTSLSSTTSAVGSAASGAVHTFAHVSKRTGGTGGRGSYEDWLNGSQYSAGTTVANAAIEAITNRFTLGARSNGDGASAAFGGEILLAAYYPRALTAQEQADIHASVQAWYARAPLAPDAGPLAGVTALSSIDLMVCGTSIEFGFNDQAENGWAGYIDQTLDPAMSDLDIEVIGAVAGAVVNQVAYSGATVRGGGAQAANGLDPRAPSHANRWDSQFTTIAAAGKFAAGRKLVIAIPAFWFNDLNTTFGLIATYDNAGDGLRLCDRIVSDIRGVDPSHDIRFVVLTCTPENITVGGTVETEIALARSVTRDWATALAARTGCPVVVCDAFSIINSNIAGYLASGTSGGGDNIHPSQAGHRAIANGVSGVVGMRDAIRFVCGLAA